MARKHLSAVGLVAAAILVLALQAANAAPLAYYTFDNSGNLGQDSGPNAYNATNNGATYNASGKFGGAASFANVGTTGPDYYIQLPSNTALDNVQRYDYTLSAWVKPTDTPPGTGSANNAYYGVVEKPGYHSGLRYDNTQKYTVESWRSYGPTDAAVSSTNTYAPGSDWHHVVATVQASSGRVNLYVDGVSQGTTAFTAGSDSYGYGTNPWRIGIANPNAGTYRWGMNGLIDDMAIWNTAISPINIRNMSDPVSPLSPTAVADAQVTYRITVSSSSTAADAGIAAFVNDSQEWYNSGKQGLPFVVRPGWNAADYTSWPVLAANGSKTITQTGSIGIRTSSDGSVSDWIQLAAKGTGTFAGNDYLNHPYVAATFTAPLGYVFKYTSGQSQYLTTNVNGGSQAAWNVSYYDYGSPFYNPLIPTAGGIYEATTPNPTLAGQGFGPGTQAIWGYIPQGPLQYAFLSTQATLAPGNWTVYGDPLQSLPGDSMAGLSGLFVRTTGAQGTAGGGAITSLDNADIALTLRQGGSGAGVYHDMSQARVNPVNQAGNSPLTAAHIDSQGSFSGPQGLLAGGRDNGSNSALPDNIATMLAGYIYVPSAGLARSFAVFGDDDAYLKVGDTELTRGAGQIINTVIFPSAGYWPIQVVSRNAGAAGLEVSVGTPTWDGSMWQPPAFNTTNFQILGTDPAFPVYTRDAALGSLTNIGAESVGAPTFVPASAPSAGDGAWLNAQASLGSSMGSTSAAINWFAANPDGGTRQARSSINITNTGTGTGAFNATSAPIAAADANYPGVSSAVDRLAFRSRSLFYSPGNETVAFAINSDDGFRLQMGNRIAGWLDSGRGQGTDANMMYAYFQNPGFYKMELYHYEGTGDAGVEMSYKIGYGDLLASSRNANTLGFAVDMTAGSGRFHTFQPQVEMRQFDGVNLQGKAWVQVSGVSGAGSYFAPDYWVLQQRASGGGAPIQGLLGTYYNLANNQTVDNTWPTGVPVLGARTDFTSGFMNLANGFASALVPSRPGAPINPAPANDFFSVQWTGYLNVPQTGVYSFQVRNDDRGWMFIDVDGNGVINPATEGMPGQPQNWANWMQWNNVFLTAGMHAIDFRTREWQGGEPVQFQWLAPGTGVWNDIPASVLFQNLFDGAPIPIAFGGGLLGVEVGGLLDWATAVTFPMDWFTTYTLRLQSEFFGMQALTAWQDFTFMPEPGTMVLLAGGLLAVIRRRRRQASR